MIPPLLDQLLDPRHLALDLCAGTADEAIREIVKVLWQSGEMRQPEQFCKAVMEREESSSTVAEGNIAFPHARTGLVDEIMLGIGRSKAGVTFPGREDLVHLIFLIAVPQQLVNDYLICVGALARLLKNEETRQALMAASTPADFLERLRGES
jgi:mannitol/fructose-specific phosphotransferase system IIA component (Ntr-type)